jgi:hypothetical protein
MHAILAPKGHLKVQYKVSRVFATPLAPFLWIDSKLYCVS